MKRKLIKLNQAQQEILLSESVHGRSAVNVISIKVIIRNFTAQQIKEAVRVVIASADIFDAQLVLEEDAAYFIRNKRKKPDCRILPQMSRDRIFRYVQENDEKPFNYLQELYTVEILPLDTDENMLYVRFHHIIMDGYGMCLFVQKILDVLAGKKTEKSVYFTDDEEHGTSDHKEDMNTFWKGYFSDLESEASIFADRPRSEKRTCSFYIPKEAEVEKIKQFADENGVAVPYVLAAAYAVYLSEATGKKDVVFLMPRLNRSKKEMKTLGCYTMLIPVRVKVRQEDTFAKLCHQIQQTARQASRYKAYGYENIKRTAGKAEAVRGSLSEYVLNYYSFRIRTKIQYSLEISVAGAMYNHFTWNIFQTDGKLKFMFDLRDGIYDEKKAAYFADSISRILSDGMTDMPVRYISVLGEREQEQLLQFKGQQIEIDNKATISSMFRKAAKQFGVRPAVYAGDKKYTFAELDMVSDVVAAGLQKSGVQSKDSVAFMLKRDKYLIPAILGISKTGAAFVPVDSGYPKERIEYILRDSGAKFLISSKEVKAAKGYCYLDIEELLSGSDAVFEAPRIQQEQTAYLIYTSGTTGRPKGVMLSHRGIVNIVHPENNPFNRDIVKNGKGIVAIGSVSFDIFLFEIFVPLLNGLFVELGNEEAMVDANELVKHILRHGADILHCTPSRIVSFMKNPVFSEGLKNIRVILSAGETLPKNLVIELKNHYNIRVYNGYGPTETTIGATITQAGDSDTIGTPVSNTGILLLNKNNKPVPYGAVGEICVYGKGVGLGYKDRIKETKEAFINYGGEVIYRTGDRGYLSADKRLVYCGRKDNQVKLRGLRIELSEIGKVMEEYKGISQAECIVSKNGEKEHLTGFYVAERGRKVDEEKLRKFLKKRLTSYMIPDVLKEIDEMPKALGGKTDLTVLKNMKIDFSRPYRAPGNPTEKAVCNAFAFVLGLEQAGVDDNFFELGGDSLSVVELLLKIEKELGAGEHIKMDYASIFQNPTPALLAEKIDGKSEGQEAYDIENLDYTGIPEYLAKNRMETNGKRQLGNVLLTGVTGYLGIHILIDLLKHSGICQKVFCLARSGKTLTALERVKNALFYYAEHDFSESYGVKWFVVEGDITNPRIFRENFEEPVDTIINSAANVAHYAYGTGLRRVNVDGVKNIAAYAVSKNALLCHISTISVSGITAEGDEEQEFTETDLFIGQKIYNEYIYSKYMAEYELMRAAADRKLAVKIMRVGNLQGRNTDGEFQMNLKTNAFTRRLASYVELCAAPESVYRLGVNISPVDETAHMITALAQTDVFHSVFHVYQPKEIFYHEIFAVLCELGYTINSVSEQKFESLLQTFKQSNESSALTEEYFTQEPGEGYRETPVNQKLTKQILTSLGETWSPVTKRYLKRYLCALESMDMFRKTGKEV